MSRRRTVLAVLTVAVVLAAAAVWAFVGRGDGLDRDHRPERGGRFVDGMAAGTAKQKLLDALNPPAVEVWNGQSAVIATNAGLALFVTNMDDIYEGQLRVYESASGNFSKDAKLVADHKGKILDKSVEILGHKLTISGASDRSCHVYLDTGDEGIVLAALDTDKTAEVNLSTGADLTKVKFDPNNNKPRDLEEFRRFLGERKEVKKESP